MDSRRQTRFAAVPNSREPRRRWPAQVSRGKQRRASIHRRSLSAVKGSSETQSSSQPIIIHQHLPLRNPQRDSRVQGRQPNPMMEKVSTPWHHHHRADATASSPIPGANAPARKNSKSSVGKRKEESGTSNLDFRRVSVQAAAASAPSLLLPSFLQASSGHE